MSDEHAYAPLDNDPPIENPEPQVAELTPVETSPYNGGDQPKRRGRPKGSKNRVTSSRASATPTRRRSGDPLPGLLGTGWASIGWGMENLVPHRVGPPVGRVMQHQGAEAGETLSKALKRTPLYASIKPWVATVGPWADLAKLVTAPLIVGAVAMKPEVAMLPPIQGVLMAQLVPMMIAARKRKEAQEEEIKAIFGDATDDDFEDARDIIRSIAGMSEPEPAEAVKAETWPNDPSEVTSASPTAAVPETASPQHDDTGHAYPL